MLKVVVDTNNIVSSLINKNGLSAQLIDLWRQGYYVLITSNIMIEEIRRVLTYPHIVRKYMLNKVDAENFINLVKNEATIISDLPNVNVINDDPDDNKFLACAVEAKAEYIVSGDKHLLHLKQYRGVAIVTVREFLKLLK